MQFKWRHELISLAGPSEKDWIYSTILKTRAFYESDLLEYIRYAMKGRRGCVLDVGANIGNHSVYFGKFVGARVISFEPNPSVLPYLVENLSRNKIIHRVFGVGLGERDSRASITVPTNSENNIGAARLVEPLGGNDGAIPVVTMDSIAEDIKSFANGLEVIAIKIDVEGMEPAVLRGGMSLLFEYKPDLFVEVIDREQMAVLKGILRPIGYRPVVSWAATPVWHFVHHDRMSMRRWLRLLPYIWLHKGVRLVKSMCRT